MLLQRQIKRVIIHPVLRVKLRGISTIFQCFHRLRVRSFFGCENGHFFGQLRRDIKFVGNALPVTRYLIAVRRLAHTHQSAVFQSGLLQQHEQFVRVAVRLLPRLISIHRKCPFDRDADLRVSVCKRLLHDAADICVITRSLCLYRHPKQQERTHKHNKTGGCPLYPSLVHNPLRN